MAKPNWENRTLFHGDNLDFMRAMDSETVDLIATDPPFNRNRDFHSTPGSLADGASFHDRWRWERIHDEWLEKMQDDNPQLAEAIESAKHAHSDGMGAFVCFLSVRVMQMHRLLKPTGSLFLHCDPTASHYIKATLDAIFGRRCFRNEIVWCYRGGGVPKTAFARKHDLIFFYVKSKKAIFNPQYTSYSEASRQLVGGRGGVSIDGRERNLERGCHMPDWWTDINSLQTWSPERTGYPTQKPVELYSRIIKCASNPGDVVLDPFAGCATTCVAAALLERQWVGIDIWKKVAEVVKERIKREELPLLTKDIFLVSELPKRTDDGETSAPYLRTPVIITEPSDGFRTREERVDFLIKQYGLICQGCGRSFDHKSYLQLDHILPRADGGWNHIRNRCLLCGPCNLRKSHTLTLSGLRKFNSGDGFMYDESVLAQLG